MHFRDEWLGVHQLDRYGREVRSRFFAPTDLGAALEELDHLASEQAVLERSGVRPNRAALLTLAAAPLAEEGRLDELRARMAPGLMMEDRRPVLTDRFVDANRTIEGLRIVAERGLHVDTAIVDTRGDRLALVRYGYGSASFVEESLVVVEYDEQYRTCRSIQFPSDDPKSATAELDRLAGEHPVVRAIRYGISLASAGRWDDYAAQMHPGYRYLDRRKGVRTPDGGPDTTVGIVRVGIEELGFEQVVHLVDSRGDGVALVRHQEAQPSGFVSDALLVIQLDGDGLFELVVQFDADDLAAATAELDRVASLALGTERLDPSI